jgi:organic radical activating enzyme
MEQAGGTSDRMMHQQIPDLTPPELSTDINAINVTPRILEVYLDNVCNMSCVYCADDASSRIQKENEKFGRFEYKGVVIDNQTIPHPNKDQLKKSFWKWLENNYVHLRRFQILGGEPFFQSEFETCLEFLESHSNSELEFQIQTNLKVTPDKLDKFVQKMYKLLTEQKYKLKKLCCSMMVQTSI